MRKSCGSCLLLALLGAAPAMAQDRIGHIEFFGHKGMDIARVRELLPVREGDAHSDQTRGLVRQAVATAIGREPTDVAVICCDEQGNRLLFIGLPGASFKSFSYHPEPQGDARLTPEILELYSRLDPAIEAAVRKGGDAAVEDDSNGYALIQDPSARALQLAVRDWALQHEPDLLRVLESSAAVEHRRVASDALGYARQSRRQILALARAARDPDGEVRNNATRALGVLARSNAALASEIPPDTFIEMFNSGFWQDRNKSTALLAQLTDTGNPVLLAKIRSAALDSLIEMAAWRRPAHAYFARLLLGRIAGIPEDRLQTLAWEGPVDAILEAVVRP